MAKRPVRERYEVEWQELTEAAKARREADPVAYEHDRDNDEVDVCEVFSTEAEARMYARVVVDSRQTVYGHATITKQRREQVEGTLLWEWENIEESEYVD